MDIPVIYQDEDFIIINKPPGISVHGGHSVSGETVADILLQKFPEIKNVGDAPAIRPGIVHRLDKNTSGVMVVARNQKSFDFLKELFKNREMEKTYLAVACGQLASLSGTISFPIGRLVKNPLKRGVAIGKTKIRGEREAVTDYSVLRENARYSLVELRPKTGRMHQLRVHLKALSHPVACDTLYGGEKVCCPKGVGRTLLHAQSLSFALPGGKRMCFEADPPEDFQFALKGIL